jgi:hypothetical protein
VKAVKTIAFDDQFSRSRTRSHQHVAIQNVLSPVSRPDVAYSRPAAGPAATGSSSAPDRPLCSRRAASTARPNPPAVKSSPRIQEIIDVSGCRKTNPASASSHCQSALVDVSARSPRLQTGPFPARICSTARVKIRPSSQIQRVR